MHSYTIEVFLRLGDDQPKDALDAPLATEHARLGDRLGAIARLWSSHSLAHHREEARRAFGSLARLDSLLESGLPPASVPVSLTSFDAVLEATIPGDANPQLLVDAVKGLAGRLGPAVDVARSAVAIGTDYTIVDGRGPLRLFYCLYREPSLSYAEFSDFWRNQLVEHTTETPAMRAYHQLHADPELSARAAAAVGVDMGDIDGVALEWYPSVDGLCSAVEWATEPDAAVIEAEGQLIDFGRALAVLCFDDGG